MTAPSKRASRSRILWAALILLAATLAWVRRPSVQGDAALFEPATDTIATAQVSPEVRRSRAVRVNLAALTPEATQLKLNLFDDRVLIAEVERVDRLPGDSFVWVGRVPGGRVTLSVRGAAVSGSVALAGLERYTIRAVSSGTHLIREVDPSLLREPDGTDHVIPTRPAGAGALAVAESCEDGSIVDIMIAYTGATREMSGGTEGIEALINQRVADMNTANLESQVPFTWRLVKALEVDYAESGNILTDLDRLRVPDDGYLDEVQPVRDASKADLVGLLISQGSSGACGIAYQLPELNPWYEGHAFGVTALDYEDPFSCNGLTLAHELGHGMGNAHDRDHADPDGALFDYSFGYQSPENTFRTIMAYDCDGGTCPRINQWANPDVTYAGEPTGVDHDVNPAQSADIARSMNASAVLVANYRANCPAAPTETPTNTPSPTPDPTETPIPTTEPTETPSPTLEPTVIASASPEPTATSRAQPTMTMTPKATKVPTVEPTATATRQVKAKYWTRIPLVLGR